MKRVIRVAELFAGVGGFRVGLEAVSSAFETRFSSQWEPPGSKSKQFASRCYVSHFGPEGHHNEDIAKVLDRVESGTLDLGPIDLIVGGFPCQDYSVAKPLNQSDGIAGKKGVLWWQIHRLINLQLKAGHPPKWVFLENVDRLLKSPATQRGRDFAIMLASLSDLGYDVEWRVINAADYGFAQRRRRVFIFGTRRSEPDIDGPSVVFSDGVLARAFPVQNERAGEALRVHHNVLVGDLATITREFGRGVLRSEFLNAGFVSGRRVWSFTVKASFKGKHETLGDKLVEEHRVPSEYFVSKDALPKWRYAKGAKNEPRVHRSGGHYFYTEGALPFPDPVDRPSRTILTSEGGSSPSRSKHIVATSDARFRRLVPDELELLNGFEAGWTDTDMTATQRAFCMGNALVVGLISRVAKVIAKDAGLRTKAKSKKKVAKKRSKR